MFREIASFELKYHIKSPLFAIVAVLFFVFTYFMVAADAANFGAVNNVKSNSPYVIMQALLMMSLFATLSTTAFVVNSIHRDFELNTDALFFSRPLKKWQYLGGRFLGSFAASIAVYIGVFLAMIVGGFSPLVEKTALGPIRLFPYVYAMLVMVIPNLILIAAIFFAVAALTRSLMATYASMFVLTVFYGIAGSTLWDVEREWLAGLLDPFGVISFFVTTRYWTVFEKNNNVLALQGVFLANRALWLSIAASILALAYAKFSFTSRNVARASARAGRAKARPHIQIPHIPTLVPLVAQTFNAWPPFRSIVRLETLGTLKSIPFIIILLCGVALTAGEAIEGERIGNPLPVTRVMIESIRDGFSVITLMIAAFYAGDIIWRERTLRMNEVTDSMPVPTWLQWGAKLTSLVVVAMVTLAAAVLTTLIVQTVKGYYDYELGLYVRGVFIQVGLRLALCAGLAFLMQVFFNHKLAGFIGMAIWFVLNSAMGDWGLGHLLIRFASLVPWEYSDMNGFGHFVVPLFWANVYWLLFVALMLAVAHLFWIRGTETRLRNRLAIAKQRFTRPVKTAMAALFVAFVSSGCYIYYNTNILNTYRTPNQARQLSADMEKKYKRYEELPQPRIVHARANVDIHPERRTVYIDGSYIAINKSGAPIKDLHITWAPTRLTSIAVDIPGASLKLDDPRLGYRIYTLANPLPAGAPLTMKFRTAFEARGFPSGPSNTKVVENGTFMNNFDFFPHFGYNVRAELEDSRAKFGLPPMKGLKPPNDLKARMENAGARRTDTLSLDTVVSTTPDQIAIAPGYLQREWTANGRRYFHYKTEAPIRGFWSYLSARYTVKRDQWNGIPIEIYYHHAHPYNVDRMIRASKLSLDYFTKNFSPYQHRQFRILEYPLYSHFAQAFPNTVPWSESLGFITDLRDDEDKLDYVTYVTAHEIAHQWWGHQIVGANVQGVSMLSESLAQYSALMVLEQQHGDAKIHRYLRYELDRYLAMRGNERRQEHPLMLVERQDYIQYQKGALALYALQDAIGEERVNRALAKFLKDHAYSGPPYTTAAELVRYFRAEAPREYQSLITDLFERIILYDLTTRDATFTQRADGKYVVKMTVGAMKLEADGRGEEKPVAIDDWVDIGVLGENEKPLFIEKRRITKPEESFEIVVSEKPVRAGIDPFNKLIDRLPKDNTKSL